MPLARLERAAGEQHQGLLLPRDRLPRGAVADSPGDNWGLSVRNRDRDRGPSASDSPEREIIS